MEHTIYQTISITHEIRSKIPNGAHFDVCEDCGNKNCEAEIMEIVYYTRYKKALCDCCVDCRDGWQWEGKKDYAIESFLESIRSGKPDKVLPYRRR